MTYELKYIATKLEDGLAVRQSFLSQTENIGRTADEISSCFKKGNRLYIFGNGGSAADAQHIAGELVGRYKIPDRLGLPAFALTTDSSVITAWANDFDYNSIFSRQVEAAAREGDVLMGISTSGNSENVLRALDLGKMMGTRNISLTGHNGGKIKMASDININVDSSDTPLIQECHMAAYHIICGLVEDSLFGKKQGRTRR